MSTTVTYKGDTLTTVSNDTKTLKTAGKYMEGDVILTDVSGTSSILVTDVPNTTGTTASISADDVTTLTTKSITQNGTYAASSDGADGYSSVTVNVSGGGSVTQDANGYIIIPSS